MSEVNKDCKLQKYLKSLNPKESEQCILIYGSRYKLWKDGKYLGEAIWTEDINVGDSFQTTSLVEIDGVQRKVSRVYIPDRWELVINTRE